MGATASIEEPCCCLANVSGGGRRDEQLGLTHTHVIVALQGRSEAMNDMGMALAAGAGFNGVKPK